MIVSIGKSGFVGSAAVLILLSAVWLETKSMKYSFSELHHPSKALFFFIYQKLLDFVSVL